jgi:PTS system mannose-specific IIB component
MSARKETVTIGPNQSVSVTEAAAFDFLAEHGHAIEFRLVPDASHFSWLDAKKKLK